MNIKNIKGLKYPNETFIQYFFNSNFHNDKKKKFIEFGSSNGNNLALPYQYNHDVLGIDIDKKLTQYANENFKLYNSKANFNFCTKDMIQFIKEQKNLKVDVFLLPNIISYLKKEEFINFLKLSKTNNIYKKGADFFLRTRSIKDYRFGKGKRLESNSYLLTDNITGENGAICTCYQEYELVDILKEYLQLNNFKIFHIDNQNLQKNTIVLNSDIVIWGKIN